jgi:hypothetical protein
MMTTTNEMNDAVSELLTICRQDYARIRDAWELADVTGDGSMCRRALEAYKGLCDTLHSVNLSIAMVTQ